MKLKDIKYEIKFASQRVLRGYSDKDIWNFDEHIANVIKEVCFKLAHESMGHPMHLKEEEWKQTLLDISFGFGSYLEMRSGFYDVKDKEFKRLQKEYKKGLKLFIDNHEYLWD